MRRPDPVHTQVRAAEGCRGLGPCRRGREGLRVTGERHVLFPPFSTSDLSLGPASMDTEKQRYCVEKRFWKTRGIGWSNMLKEN